MTRTYKVNCGGIWMLAMIGLSAFVSPWFLIGLWPYPESWGWWLPCTYRRVDE